MPQSNNEGKTYIIMLVETPLGWCNGWTTANTKREAKTFVSAYNREAGREVAALWPEWAPIPDGAERVFHIDE